jgi:O-antigen/teichoic acid export membrane protein
VSIKKNTTYNLTGALITFALSLVTIPIYISLIGVDRFGIMAVAWLLLGYFGLFDLGLGTATAQRIAMTTDSNPSLCAETFWTALAMNSALGVIGGILIWPIAIYFFDNVFSVDEVLRPELSKAIFWLVLAVPLSTLSGVLTGALQGRAKFLELNIIALANSVFVQLIPLMVALLHGPDLAWLLPATILARVFMLVTLFWRCRIHIFGGQLLTISHNQARELLQFGGWVTVTSLVGPLMVIIDRFVIGATIGAKSVTYYTVPFQMAERTTILSGALSSALFPRLTSSTVAERGRLAFLATQSLATIMTPLFILSVLLIEPFLQWWINPDFATKAGLSAQILIISFWINSFAKVPYIQLQAAGRPDLVAKSHFIELIPYLLLLYIGLHVAGLAGAAMAFGIRILSDCILLSWLAGSLRAILKVLYIPGLLLFSGIAIAVSIRFGTITWWVLATSLLFLSLFWSWRNAPAVVRSLVTTTMAKAYTATK